MNWHMFNAAVVIKANIKEISAEQCKSVAHKNKSNFYAEI